MQDINKDRRVIQRLDLLRSELGLWRKGQDGQWLPDAIGSWMTEDMVDLIIKTAEFFADIQRTIEMEQERYQECVDMPMTQDDIDLMGFYNIN